MGTLVFDGAGVARCLDHATKSNKHRLAFGQDEAVPGLFLVHDQGVYLMSNGLPADKEGLDPKSPMCFVVYARGCDPKKDQDWWERARDLVGGDDFAENLPASDFKPATIEALRAGSLDVVIHVNETQFEIRLVPRRVRGALGQRKGKRNGKADHH